MSLKDDLIAAKALIDTPEKWTQNTSFERRGTGDAYCISGACQAIAGRLTGYPVFSMTNVIGHMLPGSFPGDFIDYNDHPDTTHADIMALFDRAIEAAP